MVLNEGGYTETDLYFEQLTPLVILSTTAEETGKTIDQVEDETNKAMENPATTEDGVDQTINDAPVETSEEKYVRSSQPFFKQQYE